LEQPACGKVVPGGRVSPVALEGEEDEEEEKRQGVLRISALPSEGGE